MTKPKVAVPAPGYGDFLRPPSKGVAGPVAAL